MDAQDANKCLGWFKCFLTWMKKIILEESVWTVILPLTLYIAVLAC